MSAVPPCGADRLVWHEDRGISDLPCWYSVGGGWWWTETQALTNAGAIIRKQKPAPEPPGGIPYAAAWRAPSSDLPAVNDVRTQRIIGSLVTAHHRKQVNAWTHTAAHFLDLRGDVTGFYNRVQTVIDAAILFGKGIPKNQGRRWWQVYYIILHLCPDGIDALVGSTWEAPPPEPVKES